MPQMCLYLHMHQPYRLRSFQIEEIGHQNSYFESVLEDANREVFDKVAAKSYRPMLSLLLHLVRTVPKFCFSLSITGVFLEQAQRYQPDIIDILWQLISTGKVEILAETYHHSLASLYSETEFAFQVNQHAALLADLFEYRPTVFRNTELVYSNLVAERVARLNFQGILTEGVERILQGRPRTQLYYSVGPEKLPILLKHAQLSDDIAFRFSDRNWPEYPLSVERYLQWVEVYGEHELVNLFMDFETFGEHQWADTGIFAFFESFVYQFAERAWNSFVLPSEAISLRQEKMPHDWRLYDAPYPISWADVDRDLSAWLENSFQQDCINQLYELEPQVLASGDQQLLADWRRLQTSDHFYYMCTKWSADGDVHAYFSPYRDPYEAYRRYSVVLADFKYRLHDLRRTLQAIKADQTNHLTAPAADPHTGTALEKDPPLWQEP